MAWRDTKMYEEFSLMKRRPLSEKTVYWIVSVIFAVVALSYLYVLVWMFIAACKTHSEVALDPFGLPANWNFSHFIEAFSVFEVNDNGFFMMLFNSLWFVTVSMVVNIFTTMTFAYACTKYDFPTSKWPFALIMIMMTLPIYGTGGAGYKLIWNMGLINNYAAVFFSVSAFSADFLYFQAYYQNLSWSYVEAAQIDGANDFQAYFKVMIPQTMPLLTALFIGGFIGGWSAYETQMVQQPELPTLPVGIYLFEQEMVYRARLDILFAACFIVSIPCIVLFSIFKKTMMENVSLGGMKG